MAWGSKLLEKEPVPPTSPQPERTIRSVADLARAMKDVGPVVRLPTGIATVDAAMRGGIPLPRLVVIGGAPGAGKTSLAMWLANGWARAGVHVGVLAIDEGPDGVVMRLAQMTGHSVQQLEEGDSREWESVVGMLDQLPILVADEDQGWTIDTVAAELRKRAGSGHAALVVDSIQTASAEGTATADGPRTRIDAVVKSLKHVTKAHHLVTIATCELARGSYRSKSVAEQIADIAAFKESGSIEYAGQTLFVLRNVTEEPDLIDVSVPKNRAHKKEPFRLRLDHRTVTFEEVKLPAGDEPPSKRSAPSHVDADAQLVIRTLLERPGIAGMRGLRAELRARGASIGNPRIDAAVAKLGVCRAGEGDGRIEDRPERGRPRWFYRPEYGAEASAADEQKEVGS